MTIRRMLLLLAAVLLCAPSARATTGEGGSLAEEAGNSVGASAGEEPGPGGECPQGTVRRCRCRHEGECEPDTGETCECVSTIGSCSVSAPGLLQVRVLKAASEGGGEEGQS